MPPGASEPVRIRPESAAGWLELGNAQLDSGEVSAAISSFDHAIALEPALLAAHSQRLLALHYQSSHDPAAVLAEHVRFGEMLADVPRVALPPIDRNPD